MSRLIFGALLLLPMGPLAPAQPPARGLALHLTFDKSVSDRPFTGRVYVLLSKAPISGLRAGPNWFRPEPFFARDVENWRPGEALVLDSSNTLAFPTPLDKIAKGAYHVQAVMDFDRGHASFTAAPGNGYSKAVRHELGPTSGRVSVKIDQAHKASKVAETDRVKLVEVESKLLTAFHGRPTRLRAGVILPASFSKEPRKRYPIVYEIPGFSGTHLSAFAVAGRNPTDVAGMEALWVVLDPSCKHGHHVFADSANNGPCGRALIEELIPHVEKRYRALGKPGARFVTGHSSGGWSSLWLQVTYPDFFGGTWSTAPDPVDFRDFQKIDLYRTGTNMFADKAGKRRPIARKGGKPVLWYRGFSDMEEVMGHGGQLAAFEAVFSEKGADGRPRRLWDRKTGAIDPAVARSWEKYDVRLVMERDWKRLAPKLAGKVHVYVGEEDTFYLEGATKLLKASLRKLGSDAVVEVFPGKDHSTLMDKKMRERIAREMAARFRAAKLES